MIFIPSLSMLEHLDKFGKTVSVVEWIVDLNNSLLASKTSLFQTICEMTDRSHLLENTARTVGCAGHSPVRIADTDQPTSDFDLLQQGPLFYKLKWRSVNTERSFLLVCFTNKYISFDN